MEIARRAAEAGAAGGPVDYDAIADRVFRTPEKAPVPVFDLLNASHIDAADRAHSEQLNLKRKLEVEAKRAENERERRARRAGVPKCPPGATGAPRLRRARSPGPFRAFQSVPVARPGPPVTLSSLCKVRHIMILVRIRMTRSQTPTPLTV